MRFQGLIPVLQEVLDDINFASSLLAQEHVKCCSKSLIAGLDKRLILGVKQRRTKNEKAKARVQNIESCRRLKIGPQRASVNGENRAASCTNRK